MKKLLLALFIMSVTSSLKAQRIDSFMINKVGPYVELKLNTNSSLLIDPLQFIVNYVSSSNVSIQAGSLRLSPVPANKIKVAGVFATDYNNYKLLIGALLASSSGSSGGSVTLDSNTQRKTYPTLWVNNFPTVFPGDSSKQKTNMVISGQNAPVQVTTRAADSVNQRLLMQAVQNGSWSVGRTWHLGLSADSATVQITGAALTALNQLHTDLIAALPSGSNTIGYVGINGTVPVSGTFWQATQPVSGTFWQSVQPVSGTLSVGNFPAVQPVSNASGVPLSATITNTAFTVTLASPNVNATVMNLTAAQTITPAMIIANPVQQSITSTSSVQWTVQGGGFYYMTIDNAPAVTSAFTATVVFETSPDNSTWTAVNGTPLIGLPNTTGPVSTTTTAGLYRIQVPTSALYIRARVSSYTSGTVWVYLEPFGVANAAIKLPYTPGITSGQTITGWIDVSGMSELGIRISAATTTVVTAQGTDDPTGTDIQSINVLSDNSANQTATQTISAAGTYSIINPIHKWVRFQVTTTGTVLTVQGVAARFGQSLKLNGSQSTVGVAGTPAVNVTTLAQFAASAADADATANPTTTAVRDFSHFYNGSTWDRNYGNYNTTTTDAGAKTVSFTGVTQTNFDAKGATITVLCGTVTGTSPTMSATIQFSPDAGTTWLNYGPASGAVTTTGNTIVFQVYPTNFSTAGATPAALTTGATQTVQINGTLPRTWRLNYTLGGTTPSFTITGVYVNYHL